MIIIVQIKNINIMRDIFSESYWSDLDNWFEENIG